jgi:hypothetical protein
MKRYLDKHNNFGRIWSARTPNFTISLILEQVFEKYDGDDDGETQAALDNGDMVTFDSKVIVECCIDDDLIEIGSDYLGASVYRDGETLQFMKDGYFMDMLKCACAEARVFVENMPKLRTKGYLLRES